jgi:hypothetical protein
VAIAQFQVGQYKVAVPAAAMPEHMNISSTKINRLDATPGSELNVLLIFSYLSILILRAAFRPQRVSIEE